VAPHRREDVTIAGSGKFSTDDQCVEGQRLRGGGLVDRLEQLRLAHRPGTVLAAATAPEPHGFGSFWATVRGRDRRGALGRS